MTLKTFFIPLSSLIFLSGCMPSSSNQAEPVTEIVLLSQKVQRLNAHDKQLIYRSIQDEINIYSEKGDEAYEAGYNYDAVTSYELVNFYEGYNTIPLAKINEIKKLAAVQSTYHYKQALSYDKTEKKKALIELNKVMINNPEYKDTKERLSELKSNRDIKIFLNSMENSLQMKLLNNNGDIKELKSIDYSLKNLLKYDYQNETALKAKETLKEYHNTLLKEAIELYNKGNLYKAKTKFNSILSIYKKDQTTLQYLEKIKVKNNKARNIKLAQEFINQKEYIKSMEYAKEVLRIDPNNKEAQKIIITAKEESKKEVSNLIYIGKRHYNNKNLDKARESFNEALKLDPFNNTALIYSKKIERQLETIKSLQ